MKKKPNVVLISIWTFMVVINIISTTIIHWKKYYADSRLYCTQINTLFTIYDVLDSIECCKVCFMHDNCVTSIFEPETYQCIGCKVYNPLGIPTEQVHFSIIFWKDFFVYGETVNCRDCKDILDRYKFNESRAYDIFDSHWNRMERVFCDMTTDGGGWTVFQNRFDGSVDFERDLTEYGNGFGDVKGEFWLGLKRIQQLTKTNTVFRYEVSSFTGETGYEEYDGIEILGTDQGYMLSLDKIKHKIETDLNNVTRESTLASLNFAPFSIFDVNTFNDCSGINGGGGWWYKDKTCGGFNLNGKYGLGGGFYHNGLRGEKTLKSSRMMIRKP